VFGGSGDELGKNGIACANLWFLENLRKLAGSG
jgi:hypothetical protein